jgi:hypothetical protein
MPGAWCSFVLMYVAIDPARRKHVDERARSVAADDVGHESDWELECTSAAAS